MLFQSEMGKQAPDDVRQSFWAQRADVEEETRGFADDLFRTATERTAEIDALIQKHPDHWRLDRMAAVDRNILLQAGPGLMAYPEPPNPGVITAPLEIARKFPRPD